MTTIYLKEGTELPDKKAFDEYLTPQPLAEAAVRYFCEHIMDHGTRVDNILDPSAGRYGVWGEEFAREFPSATLTGVDIQDLEKPFGYTNWYSNQDFMDWRVNNVYDPEIPNKIISRYVEPEFDIIATNPPYTNVEAFIEKCWGHLRGSGYMLMLLRLNFLASEKRQKLFKKCPLDSVIVSTQRISFYGTSTNATEYGIFCWYKGYQPSKKQPTLHFLKWR